MPTSKNSKWRRSILLLAILFCLAVVILSVAPINRMALGTRAHQRATHADIVKADRIHVSVHLALFGALACVGWFAAQSIAKSPRKAVLGKTVALTVVLFIGFFTELLQHLSFRNALEWNDVFTNSVATLCAFALCELIFGSRLNPQPRPQIADANADTVAYVLRDR